MVLYLVLAVFAVMMVIFLGRLFIDGGTWAMQPYNKHMGTSAMGKITDRDGVVLAQTVDGSRVYADDLTTRKALLHTIGDTDGYIGTGVQTIMRDKLSGYNIITGINNTVLTSWNTDVKLTLSAQVSADAYNALGEKKGAVMVYNYETGEVICKVSSPTYDPQDKPSDIETNENYKGVYVDRNLLGSFAPGSTFKIVTQAAAMDKYSNTWEGIEYTCNGSVEIGGNKINCIGNHGTIGPYAAMGNSCNVYYSLLANDLGADTLQKKAEEMGFNKSLSFGDVSCTASSVDLSSADSNQLGWAGVGQYTDLSNPYHIMAMMGAIAEGGTYTEPKLTSSSGLFDTASSSSRTLMSSTTASQLKNLMRNNVKNYYGDSMFPSGMEICGKSGTAEVDGKSPTSWFVGFSSSSSTPYAFVVVIEEGGGGLSVAGNAASKILTSIVNNVS